MSNAKGDSKFEDVLVVIRRAVEQAPQDHDERELDVTEGFAVDVGLD